MHPPVCGPRLTGEPFGLGFPARGRPGTGLGESGQLGNRGPPWSLGQAAGQQGLGWWRPPSRGACGCSRALGAHGGGCCCGVTCGQVVPWLPGAPPEQSLRALEPGLLQGEEGKAARPAGTRAWRCPRAQD